MSAFEPVPGFAVECDEARGICRGTNPSQVGIFAALQRAINTAAGKLQDRSLEVPVTGVIDPKTLQATVDTLKRIESRKCPKSAKGLATMTAVYMAEIATYTKTPPDYSQPTAHAEPSAPQVTLAQAPQPATKSVAKEPAPTPTTTAMVPTQGLPQPLPPQPDADGGTDDMFEGWLKWGAVAAGVSGLLYFGYRFFFQREGGAMAGSDDFDYQEAPDDFIDV